MAALFDAHTHVVSADRAAYPLDRTGLPGAEWVDVAPDADAFAADLTAAQVDGAVLVQPNGAYRFDNRYLVAAASGRPDVFASMATVDVTAPGALEAVDALFAAGVTGLRIFSIPTPAVAWLGSAGTDAVVAACADAGAAVAVCALPAELGHITALAHRHPAVHFIVDHAAFVSLEPTSPARDSLAEVPNLVLKVTTHVLDHHLGEGLAPEDLVASLAAQFGADRLCWGSDWAQTHDRPYGVLADLGRRSAERLSPAERASFLGGTCRRLFSR